jgi:hypothetical protein
MLLVMRSHNGPFGIVQNQTATAHAATGTTKGSGGFTNGGSNVRAWSIGKHLSLQKTWCCGPDAGRNGFLAHGGTGDEERLKGTP